MRNIKAHTITAAKLLGLLMLPAVIILLMSDPGDAGAIDQRDEVHVSIGGIEMKIPSYYFPRAEKELYKKRHAVESIRIQLIWPTLEPFVDKGGDSPVSQRYKDRITVLMSESNGLSANQQSEILGKILRSMLDGREFVGSELGLEKYSHQGGGNKESGGLHDTRDIFVFPSALETRSILYCIPMDLQLKRATIVNPTCEHQFYVKNINGVRVTVSYFTSHFAEWLKIEQAVGNLLDSFVLR